MAEQYVPVSHVLKATARLSSVATLGPAIESERERPETPESGFEKRRRPTAPQSSYVNGVPCSRFEPLHGIDD